MFGTKNSNVIAWSVCWSSLGFRGFDYVEYSEWLRSRERVCGFGYVRKHGFGHEWWNFYEGFDREHYYGFAYCFRKPKGWKEKRYAILFVSKHPRERRWYLVGVYGDAKILEKPLTVSLLETVSSRFRSMLRPETVKELQLFALYIVAKKSMSTPLPRPMPINIEKDLSIRFGRSKYVYIDKAIASKLLSKALKYIDEITSTDAKDLWIDPNEARSRISELLRWLEAEGSNRYGRIENGEQLSMSDKGSVEVFGELLKDLVEGSYYEQRLYEAVAKVLSEVHLDGVSVEGVLMAVECFRVLKSLGIDIPSDVLGALALRFALQSVEDREYLRSLAMHASKILKERPEILTLCTGYGLRTELI